jgi:hypothetical protein
MEPEGKPLEKSRYNMFEISKPSGLGLFGTANSQATVIKSKRSAKLLSGIQKKSTCSRSMGTLPLAVFFTVSITTCITWLYLVFPHRLRASRLMQPWCNDKCRCITETGKSWFVL